MSILIGVSSQARTWLVAGVLVLLSIFIGREVFLRLIAPAAPLNFDEAAHSLPGYYVLRDILALDLRALWGDFHIQTLWPPGFSLLQAPFLGILGRSDESARLFAYLMLVVRRICHLLGVTPLYIQDTAHSHAATLNQMWSRTTSGSTP